MASKASAPGLQRINAAAVEIIGRDGFARATTQEIAKAAGVSEGLIYRYYQTKLDLGQGLFRKHYQDLLALLKETASHQGDPLERVRSVAGEFCRWFDQNQPVARFLIRTHQEFVESFDIGQGLIALTSSALKGILGEAMFMLLPSDILSAMIVGAFLQVCVECTHGQVKGPLAPRMEPLVNAMVGLLRNAIPSSRQNGPPTGPSS